MRDIASAQDVIDKPSVQHALSTTKRDEFKEWLLSDSYAFTYLVCGHRDMVPEVHMAMSYAACGLADKLAWTITQSGFEGYVIDQFRNACAIRGIDPATQEGIARLSVSLEWVNARMTRGAFKSSVVTHGGVTFTGTLDPNSTNKITAAVNEKSWELCDQVADTLRSGRYRDIFPERIPIGNEGELITSKHITFGGRNISHPQTTVQAAGYKTKDTGGHYDHFWVDDLVVGGEGGNATPAELPGVRSWLTGLPGFFMNTRRVRTIHAGTRWDENDDHVWLTSGKRAFACFSIVVPIETYPDGEVVNIMERGIPTMPTFLPKAKIQALQDRTLADETELEGAQSWRCNNLLDPGVAGGRLFSARVFEDKNRQWMGPIPHPKARRDKRFENRFLVARYARNEEGFPIDKNDVALVEKYMTTVRDPFGREMQEQRMRPRADWRDHARKLMFDPWVDMDRVLTLDPSWTQGGNNWAITAAAIDHESVKFQLETLDDTNGMEGWMDALAEMDDFYQPRVIGFGAGGYQDPVVKNILRTDKRLRKLRHKVVGVSEHAISKKARIRAGVAEPLASYKWLLDPSEHGAATREEMRNYKGDPKAVDGILDSMSMVDALLRRVRSPEQREEAKKRYEAAERRYRTQIDPILGVPYAA